MKRATGEERMDDPALDPTTYAQVLTDLGQVNRWTLAARPTLRFLDSLLPVRAERTGEDVAISVLDVGFGDGGMLRAIAAWADRHGVAVDLTGVDLNPKSAAVARSLTSPDMPIRYVTGDYADQAVPDIVLSSLVAHHMSRTELLRFLRWMEKHATRGWMVNDLHRHRLAHLGWPVLAAAMRWHPIVRHDGHLSIARSFVPAEWNGLLAKAGIADARIVRRFPFRLCVERPRSAKACVERRR